MRLSTPETAKKCADIGKRLQKERESLGFRSQEQFAAAVEKSKRTVTNWESGDSAPDAGDLKTMWDMGIDISYVVAGVRGFASVKDAAQLTYATPARKAADAIAGLPLATEDADMVMSLAMRLAKGSAK